MKPTIEEVREHFKNAAEVECLSNGIIYDLTKIEITKGCHYFCGDVFIDAEIILHSILMWDEKKGYAKIITYKNNMEITEQQIKDLESGKVEVKELFPDVFKEKIESGFWYKYKGEDKFLTYIKEDYTRCGIGTDGIWFEYGCKIKNASNYIKATNEDVKDALIKEAVKRGYKKGDLIKRPFDVLLKDLVIDDTYLHEQREWIFDFKRNFLEYHGFVIFYNGIWAEIIPQEEKLYTEKDLVNFGNKVLQDAKNNIYSQIENFKLNR